MENPNLPTISCQYFISAANKAVDHRSWPSARTASTDAVTASVTLTLASVGLFRRGFFCWANQGMLYVEPGSKRLLLPPMWSRCRETPSAGRRRPGRRIFVLHFLTLILSSVGLFRRGFFCWANQGMLYVDQGTARFRGQRVRSRCCETPNASRPTPAVPFTCFSMASSTWH